MRQTLDGAGLFCAVIKHLLGRGEDCPKVLVATHFHDVFKPDLLDPTTPHISFLHMQIMFSSTSDTDMEANTDSTHPVASREKITYLYR